MLTFEQAHELFEYRDGRLIYKVSRPRRKAGTEAGSIDSYGYLRVGVKYKTYKIHHVVWLMHYGVLPEQMLDHINRVRTDNRIENLRLSTPLEQASNTSTTNSSGLRGVDPRPNGKFRARRFGQTLGIYDTAREAHEAFNEALK